MDFKILGPLEVDDGDRPIPLGGARQRALLAAAAASRERGGVQRPSGRRPVGRIRARPPKRSRWRCPGCARRSGPADRWSRARPATSCSWSGSGSTSTRFEDEARAGREALASGDAKLARAKLGDALAIWRGPALADLAYEPFAQAEASRLEELRASVTEERIAADLELGRHADLVGELQELVTRHPLRERLRGQLMLALYRSGRQADALEVYQDARRALTDELGIEPGRELRELQEAMLRQDPALDRPPRPAGRHASPPSAASSSGASASWPSWPLDWTTRWPGAAAWSSSRASPESARAGWPTSWSRRPGREARGSWWAAAGRRAARPRTGRGCSRCAPTAVSWSPTLCGRSSARAAATSPSCCPSWASCSATCHRRRPGLRGCALPPVRGGHLVPAQRRRGRTGGADVRRRPRRRRAVAAPASVPRPRDGRRAASWWSAPSATSTPRCRRPLTATLVELAREPHTARISLGGLAEDEVLGYIEQSTGVTPPAELVAAIHRETDGNPLFVVEVVQLLAADGQIGEPGAELRIPPGVREVIGRRVARLPEALPRPPGVRVRAGSRVRARRTGPAQRPSA